MLYIVRHGKTEWNSLQKLQGQTDTDLNEEGIQMAQKAAKEYADVHFDICYSSPLKRAVRTAELILEGRNVPIITDDRLKEMSFGQYEGSVGYFEDDDFPLRNLFQEPARYTKSIGGAESFDELFARTGEFLDQVVKPELEKGLDILIVGHGAMNCSIICQINNIPISDFWKAGIENCKLKCLV